VQSFKIKLANFVEGKTEEEQPDDGPIRWRAYLLTLQLKPTNSTTDAGIVYYTYMYVECRVLASILSLETLTLRSLRARGIALSVA